jgi:hypothetical protein
MREAIPPLSQYAYMAWCSLKKAQGQLYLYTYNSSDIHFEIARQYVAIEILHCVRKT